MAVPGVLTSVKVVVHVRHHAQARVPLVVDVLVNVLGAVKLVLAVPARVQMDARTHAKADAVYNAKVDV